MSIRRVYNIAGHNMAVVSDDNLGGLDILPGFQLFETDAEPEWFVHFGVWLPDFQGQQCYAFDFDDGSYECAFFRSEGGCLFEMLPRNQAEAPFRMVYEGGVDVYANCVPAASALRFALWMAFSFLGASHGCLPVHSSTVVCNNRAVLCLGESGTGKSTHTRLWLNTFPDARLLNDDSPILCVDGESVRVWGSPWSGKTHCYHNRVFPLAAFVRLSQAPHNEIRRLSTIEAVCALQPSFPPALSSDEYFLGFVMEGIGDIVSRIPVYHLACLPDHDAARLCHSTIFNV